MRKRCKVLSNKAMDNIGSCCNNCLTLSTLTTVHTAGPKVMTLAQCGPPSMASKPNRSPRTAIDRVISRGLLS